MLFILLPVLAIYASGLWLMNRGLQQAPVGFEDQEGFHFASAPTVPFKGRNEAEAGLLSVQSRAFSF